MTSNGFVGKLSYLFPAEDNGPKAFKKSNEKDYFQYTSSIRSLLLVIKSTSCTTPG